MHDLLRNNAFFQYCVSLPQCISLVLLLASIQCVHDSILNPYMNLQESLAYERNPLNLCCTNLLLAGFFFGFLCNIFPLPYCLPWADSHFAIILLLFPWRYLTFFRFVFSLWVFSYWVGHSFLLICALSSSVVLIVLMLLSSVLCL